MAEDEAVISGDGLGPNNIDEVYVPYKEIEDDTIEKGKPEIEFDEKLDPAVVKSQGDAIGEIGLALRYRQDKELLMIRVVSAHGLASRQVARLSVDPQVEVSLLDSVEQDIARTTIKKNSNNPVWNEILTFKVDEYAVEGTRVLFRVLDGGDVIGELMIPLDWDILEGETEWFDLQDQRDWSISGALHVRVRYTNPTTLHVNVASAEGLCGKDKDKMSDPYVRVTLAGKYPVKTTKVIKGTVNPVWSETFDFAIPVQLLQTATILLAVYNKNIIESDDFLGEARISLSEFKYFHEIDNWFPLADLKHVARHRSEWSKGAVEQELREALVAHITCRSPQLVFNNTSNKNRVIRLSCPKAGQKSKITIVNGKLIFDN
ncbi:hypothetical protein ACHWQZ_G009820 [Mnemiopsis leidyi]